MMQVSAAGRARITEREGRKLKAYRDAVGVLTIGVGHTGRMAAPAVTEYMVITGAQADAFLAADLAPVELAINKLGLALTQNQFDALASLAFNIGVPGFMGSTVVRKLRAGDMTGAAHAFLLWEKPAVLKVRRELECAQFLTPDPIAPQPSGQPSASGGTTTATSTKGNSMGGIVSGIVGGLHLGSSALGTIISLGSQIPNIVEGVENVVPVATTLVGDIEKIIADGKAGKWSDEPDDIKALLGDIAAAWTKSGLSQVAVAAAAAKAPHLPSVSGIAQVKAALAA